jgi:hypothetical protein
MDNNGASNTTNSQIPPSQNTAPAVSQADLARAEAIAGSSPKIPFYKNRKTVIIISITVLILILVVGVIIAFATKHTPQTITLTESQANSTIHIKPNDTVIINTKEPEDMNIGTGVSNPDVLRLNGKSYGPGTGTYDGKFTALKPGETDIVVTAAPTCKKGDFCTPMQELIYKAHIIVDK